MTERKIEEKKERRNFPFFYSVEPISNCCDALVLSSLSSTLPLPSSTFFNSHMLLQFHIHWKFLQVIADNFVNLNLQIQFSFKSSLPDILEATLVELWSSDKYMSCGWICSHIVPQSPASLCGIPEFATMPGQSFPHFLLCALIKVNGA